MKIILHDRPAVGIEDDDAERPRRDVLLMALIGFQGGGLFRLLRNSDLSGSSGLTEATTLGSNKSATHHGDAVRSWFYD